MKRVLTGSEKAKDTTGESRVIYHVIYYSVQSAHGCMSKTTGYSHAMWREHCNLIMRASQSSLAMPPNW